MPKNVQSFVDKYGGIGSKEQDSAFWKGFRKAANAYANVQAKRICDLENALVEEKKNSNKIEDNLRVELRGHPDSELWGDAGLIAATMRCVDAVDTITEQRDRLAEALKYQKELNEWIENADPEDPFFDETLRLGLNHASDLATEALQSLNQPTQ